MTHDLQQQQITELQQTQARIVGMIGDLIELHGTHTDSLNRIFEDFYEEVEEEDEFDHQPGFGESYKSIFGRTPSV